MKNERFFMLCYHFLIYGISLHNYNSYKKEKQIIEKKQFGKYFILMGLIDMVIVGKCTDYFYFFQGLISSFKYITLYNLIFYNNKLKMIDFFRIYKKYIIYSFINFIII